MEVIRLKKSRSFELAWLETETKRTGGDEYKDNEPGNCDEFDCLMTNTRLSHNELQKCPF